MIKFLKFLIFAMIAIMPIAEGQERIAVHEHCHPELGVDCDELKVALEDPFDLIETHAGNYRAIRDSSSKLVADLSRIQILENGSCIATKLSAEIFEERSMRCDTTVAGSVREKDQKIRELIDELNATLRPEDRFEKIFAIDNSFWVRERKSEKTTVSTTRDGASQKVYLDIRIKVQPSSAQFVERCEAIEQVFEYNITRSVDANGVETTDFNPQYPRSEQEGKLTGGRCVYERAPSALGNFSLHLLTRAGAISERMAEKTADNDSIARHFSTENDLRAFRKDMLIGRQQISAAVQLFEMSQKIGLRHGIRYQHEDAVLAYIQALTGLFDVHEESFQATLNQNSGTLYDFSDEIDRCAARPGDTHISLQSDLKFSLDKWACAENIVERLSVLESSSKD